MPGRTSDNRVPRAAAKGAFVGLVASFSIRLADTPLGFLVWTMSAVFLGSVATVLYELVFGKDEPEESVEMQEPQLRLFVTSTQLERLEKVSLVVPEVGEVDIILQPNWRDGGLLRISGLLPDDEVVVARLRVIDE
jgi:hypothetical protein